MHLEQCLTCGKHSVLVLLLEGIQGAGRTQNIYSALTFQASFRKKI